MLSPNPRHHNSKQSFKKCQVTDRTCDALYNAVFFGLLLLPFWFQMCPGHPNFQHNQTNSLQTVSNQV